MPYQNKQLQQAYNAGRDCGLNGPNTTNCHFSLFATPEMTKAWEHGKRDADDAAAREVRVKELEELRDMSDLAFMRLNLERGKLEQQVAALKGQAKGYLGDAEILHAELKTAQVGLTRRDEQILALEQWVAELQTEKKADYLYQTKQQLDMEQAEAERDTLRERLAAVEKDVLLYAAKHARCEERLAEVVIALQQIAEDGCKMPWGIACQRTTGGEQWCEGCIAEAALAKASKSA